MKCDTTVTNIVLIVSLSIIFVGLCIIPAYRGITCSSAWFRKIITKEEMITNGCPTMIEYSSPQIVEIDHGANLLYLSVCNSSGNDWHTTEKTLQLIPKESINYANPDLYRWTPLHVCARCTCIKCCVALLEYGAKPFEKDDFNNYPLDMTSTKEMHDVISATIKRIY
jgi:hypothetical protein